ncbi:MAG: helix-turn-helix domain-containing protein, partial [Clostridia bacterium]|nr:helix-turn-helix domain-containing protein [Clostridia bacterium]
MTTTQLARICGVSQGTVDRALHNRGGINPETKARILEIAKEYDYRPNNQTGDQANS